MNTGNELAKAIANVQSDWLKKGEASRSSQTFLKPFELCDNCESVVSYSTENGSSRHFTSPFLS